MGFIAIENIFCTKVHQFIDTKVCCLRNVQNVLKLVSIRKENLIFFSSFVPEKWAVDGASFFSFPALQIFFVHNPFDRSFMPI